MLYLRDALYLDPENFGLTRGDLAVEEGPQGRLRISVEIPGPDKREAGDRVLDCGGRLVTRALACGHHHIYSALSRGMPPAVKAPTNFNEVLEYVWWRLDKCLDKDMIFASALYCAMGMARRGVTFCIDHHASPFAIDGCLSTIAEAFDRVGIGHLLCYESSDRDGEAIGRHGLDEHERYFSAGGKGHVGLHASFTVGDSLLNDAVALARKFDTGIHIHVAEAPSDQEHCLATYGRTVVQRLKDAGALDLPKTILGHCVHISDEDRKILADAPCWVVQNTESNLNNNVGLTGYGYSERVMLGTDGMHSDMLRSAQAAYFNGISAEGLSPAGAYGRLRNVHRHAELHGCGAGENSLVVLDYDRPTPLTPANALGHMFYGMDSGSVRDVISQGRIIVEGGRLTMCEESDILAFANEQAGRLWSRLS